MEVQIKNAVKAGNSSAVIVPRSWLNQKVRIELLKKTSETMLLDVISITSKYLDLKWIIGIYLTGSYARGEEDLSSDIDILVITKNIDRKIIKEGIYNILIISSELINQKLEQDLFPIGQMIREAKPLLNSDYLDLIKIKIKITKKNVKWYINTTEDKLDLIKKAINRYKKNDLKFLSDKIAYTLILRLRTLHIIEKLIKNRNYSKREFIKLIEKISKNGMAYERYLAVKNDRKEKNETSLEEIERLHDYLNNQLIEVKKLLKDRA